MAADATNVAAAESIKNIFREIDVERVGYIREHIFRRALMALDPSIDTEAFQRLVKSSSYAVDGRINYTKFIDELLVPSHESVKRQHSDTGTVMKQHRARCNDLKHTVDDEEYLLITKYRATPVWIKEMLSKYEQTFDELSEKYQMMLFKSIDNLDALMKAETFLRTELTHIDEMALSRILGSCTLSEGETQSPLKFDDSHPLDLIEFERLHKAVGQIIGDMGQASWGLVGEIYSSDVRAEFDHVNLDHNKTINIAEVASWMCRIYRTVARDQAISKRFNAFSDFLNAVEIRCRAIRECEKFLKVLELHQALSQYGMAYRALKASKYTPIPPKNASAKLEQPPCNDLNELFDQGRKILNKVATLVEQVRVAIGSNFDSMGPLKGMKRAKQKVEKDYEGNHRRLLDVVRCSIICDNLAMMQNAIDFLENHEDIEVKRIKSGFTEASSAFRQGGYRDCKLSCAHKYNGHIFEVQLHVLSFYALKREGGHELYTWSRQFDVAGIVTAADVLDSLTPELLQDMLIVARGELDTVIANRGTGSLLAMQWRIALLQICRLCDMKEDLNRDAPLLHHMIEEKKIPAASKNDGVEVKLLCVKCNVYQPDQSLEICHEVLADMEKIPQDDRTSVEKLFLCRAHQLIGSCLLFRGRQLKGTNEHEKFEADMQEAEKQYTTAIELFREHVKEHHLAILAIKQNLGAVLFELDRKEEAIKFLEKYEKDVVEKMGDKHIQSAKASTELAKVYMDIKRYDEAFAHFERSLHIRILTTGENHSSVAKGYGQLAECRQQAEDYRGALANFEKACEIYEELDRMNDKARLQHSGRVSISREITNTQKEMNKHVAKLTQKITDVKSLIAESGEEPSIFVGTLNFLGNAYNPLEFMNNDQEFQVNYPRIKETFDQLTCQEVIAEAEELGFTADWKALLPRPLQTQKASLSGKIFVHHCTKEFLKRDNKLDITGRINMIVCGMMPLKVGGKPLYTFSRQWRDLMRRRVAHYANDPELVAWDIACNLTVERSITEYTNLCKDSYLNPDMIAENVRTLLMRLPENQEFVCAVQEFPAAGTPKFEILEEEVKKKGWQMISPEQEEDSVGFIFSAGIAATNFTRSPLGTDPAKVYEALGLTGYDTISKKDRESLATTVKKTMVLHISAQQNMPPMRIINVHAKEFKTSEGTQLLGKYIRGLAGDANGYTAVALMDANTPSTDKTMILDQELREQRFRLLSPAKASYITTRKQRSKMHGQIYDDKKCLQVVEAHKTYVAIMNSSTGGSVCGSRANAAFYPDLRYDDEMCLPNSQWPTDHCMCYITLHREMS